MLLHIFQATGEPISNVFSHVGSFARLSTAKFDKLLRRNLALGVADLTNDRQQLEGYFVHVAKYDSLVRPTVITHSMAVVRFEGLTEEL